MNANSQGKPATAETRPFRIIERARWSDVDAAGIVCYGAYLRFFELAETELFRALGLPIAEVPRRYGFWLVRRRVECDFFQPVRLDEELEIFAYVANVGNASLGLGFFARKPGARDLVAESQYAVVAVDREKFSPVSLPPEPRAVFVAAEMARDEAIEAADMRDAAGEPSTVSKASSN